MFYKLKFLGFYKNTLNCLRASGTSKPPEAIIFDCSILSGGTEASDAFSLFF